MKRLFIALLLTLICAGNSHALDIWHSNTDWQQGYNCYQFTIDAQDILFADYGIDGISHLLLEVNILNADQTVQQAGKIEVTEKFADSDATRYAIAYWEDPSEAFGFVINRASAVISGKMHDLIGEDILKIKLSRAEDPLPLTLASQHRERQYNHNSSFTETQKFAEMGNVDAQCNLGLMYAKGQGVERDRIQAVYWFRKAAEQDHAQAQDYLGRAYYEGKGVERDYGLALQWSMKAAKQGIAEAQYNVGFMYFQGHGVKLDYAQAAHWLSKSAEQGYAPAQNNLGLLYANGLGVKQDFTLAAHWFRKAIDQGNEDAPGNLRLLKQGAFSR